MSNDVPFKPSSIAVMAASQSVLYPTNFPSLFLLAIVFTAPIACKRRSREHSKYHNLSSLRHAAIHETLIWVAGLTLARGSTSSQ